MAGRPIIKSSFTEKEEAKFIKMYPVSSHKEMIAAFPLHTVQDMEYFIKKYNTAVKSGEIKGEILRKTREARYRKPGPPPCMEAPNHIIPLKPVIDFDLYAYRMGYLLTTESRASGSGVLESQSVRLKAA